MLEGDLFASNKKYVRKQIIYCLLQVRLVNSGLRQLLAKYEAHVVIRKMITPHFT